MSTHRRRRNTTTTRACAVVVVDAAATRSSASSCELLAIEDEGELSRELKERGLDARNVAVKVVASGVRSVVFWFDPERVSSSAARLGVAAAALRADGERVTLRLDRLSPDNRLRAAVAVAKAAYVFRRKNSKDIAPPPVDVFGGVAQLRGFGRVAEMTAWAADVENAPSNAVGPPELARMIVERCCPPGCRSRVIGAAELARLGFGLLLGVGRGGEKPPCAVVLSTPRRRGHPLVALVGKGITYDAGGIALKPLSSMHGQHGDKSGAAVAAAVFRLHAERPASERGFDLVAVLPIAENLVSAKSVRPGDVLTAFDGTTVEVVNPDAEGRLVLADAIAFACKTFKPDALIDFATLTHTAETMHPDASAAVFAERDEVARACEEAGEACGERVLRLPKWTEYGYETDSPVADARNSGWATKADGYMAAMFLRRFVAPEALRRDGWVHVDFGKNEATGTSPASGTGPFVGTGVALGVLIASALGQP
jgi:leucyl aminopeptidase